MKNNPEKSLTSKEKHEILHFDQLAKDYDHNYSYDTEFTKYKIKNKCAPLISDLQKLVPKAKILELGCGTGEYTKIIAKAVPTKKFIGLDISPGVISVAKQKCKNLPNVSFQVASAYNTGISANSVDYVFGFYILHHLDIQSTAKEMNRILKPGGKAYFYEPNILNPVVYIIKSNKTIKKLVGDSPDEWGINPLNLEKTFSPLTITNSKVTEFTIPLSKLPPRFLISLDKILSLLGHIPFLNLFGGSVCIRLEKNTKLPKS